jgi:hypothetical protein
MQKIFFGKGYLIGSLWVVMLCSYGCKEKYDIKNNNMNTDTSTDISPNETEVSYDAFDFDALDFECAMRLTVTQGKEYSLKIKGDPTDIQDLDVSVNAKTLKIFFKQDRKKRYRLIGKMTMPALQKIAFKGAIASVINGFEDTQIWDLKLTGVSTTKMKINAQSLDGQIIGASIAQIVGVCPQVNAKVEGASSFDGTDLSTKNTILEVNGTSNTTIRVSDKLKATATGVSSVFYYGNPITDLKTQGVSVIVKK